MENCLKPFLKIFRCLLFMFSTLLLLMMGWLNPIYEMNILNTYTLSNCTRCVVAFTCCIIALLVSYEYQFTHPSKSMRMERGPFKTENVHSYSYVWETVCPTMILSDFEWKEMFVNQSYIVLLLLVFLLVFHFIY